ncbi:hypothetical protein SLEP1_g57099 [Rubroshorea leprosula]|uniref:Uncharacterized protein n=1 Tax=Rubroshorea leprosula TaxID=152421 RepID=A0AAV5MK72_9ROSI|nr:hypothetical protein SLEP1_g57097 [Rubroshorea leprosula]GKV50393.1 hypothetical protein SLEP1_g57099 [Rubroshorea leprosula]
MAYLVSVDCHGSIWLKLKIKEKNNRHQHPLASRLRAYLVQLVGSPFGLQNLQLHQTLQLVKNATTSHKFVFCPFHCKS